MKKRILRDLLILLVIFGLIWAIFTLFPIFPDNKIEIISVKQEKKLGQVLIDDYLYKNSEHKLVKDSIVLSAMSSIAQRLRQNMDSAKFEYEIIVEENYQANAFALPGGKIVIYSKLIELTDSPEELAAVIAHEMGHVEKRHVVFRLIKTLGLGVLTGGDQYVLGEIAKIAASTSFDRAQEREADEFSLNLLQKSNINPKVLGSFFRKLKKFGADYITALEPLMTHPHIDSRIRIAYSFSVSSKFKSKPIQIDWIEVKNRLSSNN